MNQHVREAFLRSGFPAPAERTYAVQCMWRPPKDQWPTAGAKHRRVMVMLNDTGDHRSAAIEACLYLIARHRGKATAIAVIDQAHNQCPITGLCFDWSWYDGVVTYGAEVVDVLWS
jgi:hypothetical protein